MKFFKVFLPFVLLSSSCMAFDECGIYLLKGVFHKEKVLKESYFSVNVSTKSERRFYFNKPLAIAKLMIHEKENLQLKVRIDGKMDGTKWVVSELLEITDPVHAINPFSEFIGYKLVEKKECRK